MQVAPVLAKDLVPNIVADPDDLFSLPGCRVIKDQQKIKVARINISIQDKAKTIYVKRYNAYSWRYRVGSWFQSSGAIKSLKGAAVLAEAGIPTARCLAAIETRSWGMLQRSFFLSQEIPNSKTADAYWCEELVKTKGHAGLTRRRLFLNDIGALFSLLHRHEIYHDDLKDANILVGQEAGEETPRFYLLDVQGVRRYRKLSRRRRIKNIVQLYRTLGRYLRRPDQVRFLKSYLGPLFEQKKGKREWVTEVLRQSNKVDAQRALKHRASNLADDASREPRLL